MRNRVYKGALVPHDPRWDEFENFLADMGERPPGTSLDRIDFNGIYEKSNCRWASTETQIANRRNTKWLTIDGETKTVAAWARHAGITYGALNARIVSGWPTDRILAPMKELVLRNPASTIRTLGEVAAEVVATFADELTPDLQQRLTTAIRQAIERASKEPLP